MFREQSKCNGGPASRISRNVPIRRWHRCPLLRLCVPTNPIRSRRIRQVRRPTGSHNQNSWFFSEPSNHNHISILQVKPADVGSYVNYFMERKNGDVADDEPDFVPPMVGESEIIFTTFEAVPVQGRIRFIESAVRASLISLYSKSSSTQIPLVYSKS